MPQPEFSNPRIKRLIILDGNPPWVRSLFLAMPAHVDVRFLRVGNPGVFKQMSDRPWRSARQWQPLSDHASERWVIIPGWGKTPGISGWLARRAVLSAARADGGFKPSETAVVLTLPQYAPVAERLPQFARAYDAHDTFSFYAWDRERTIALETRMLNACDVSFAVAKQVREDLAALTSKPVFNSFMAVSSSFITSLRGPAMPVPADIANLPRPIIGCTGSINYSYDWKLLGELADRMPEASLVFIGPVNADTPEHRAMIDAVLKNRRNVHWLGRKPHAELPAYLRAFDICLNPLEPTPHADRRSPLRLFDYLATDKPIVSTNIAEAPHEGHVWVANTAEDMAALIRAGYSGERKIDLPSRQKYIEQNTWEMRALDMLTKIEASETRRTKFE